MKTVTTARPNELLKRARELQLLSQSDLALKLGLPDWRMVSRWERGISFPSYHYRRLLCDYFGKSAKELGLLAASDNFWNIPYPQNPLFTAREDILHRLHDLLVQDRTKWPLALNGMAGVGKTQIALEYAYRHREDYHAVFWIRASSREILASDFVTMAALLNIHEQGEKDQGAVIHAVKQWLSSLNRWLLIFDDVEDLHSIEDYLPTSYQGHVLCTTRSQITGGRAEILEVPSMEAEEGASLLLRRAKKIQPFSTAEFPLAEEIVVAMGGLPLALDQAGAYIEQTQCGVAEYLQLYQKHTGILLQERGDLVTGHPESVTTTLQLVFEKVQQTHPQAMELLCFLAALNLNVILDEMITENSSLLGPTLAPLVANKLLLNAAFRSLLNYSLIRREANMIHLHPLIREEINGAWEEEEHRRWTTIAEKITGHVTPLDERQSS